MQRNFTLTDKSKEFENERKKDKRGDGNWEGWGDYMEVKRKKLSNQFAGEEKLSTIFNGVSIYVNGYTCPSADILKRLIIQNGGEYHVYHSSRTTHVIATNLPQSKISKLKPGDKYIHPDWITESIKANILLPDSDYQLYVKVTNNITNYVSKNDVQSAFPVPTVQKQLPISAKDPNFIRDYYAQSRLHMISTWGQEMKEFVKMLVKSNDETFSGRQNVIDYLSRTERNDEEREKCRDKTVFMHLDMDCFFVSVGLRDRPSLKGFPVVVTHSNGTSSSHSDIASCSYEARKAGIKNGMWLGEALKRCPNIKTIPYDFEKYKTVSKELYQIVASYTLAIEAVSCDELYAELTEVCQTTGATPLQVVSVIREEIVSKTSCCASAGLGPNMLIARLATRKAKPNGQYYVTAKDSAEFMKKQKIDDLPGVGRSTSEKLDRLKIYTCYDLSSVPLNVLQKEFGQKTGQHLFNFAKGVDDRKIKSADSVVRKSVSCDVNYGIRFEELRDMEIFLNDLSKEVARRLSEIEMKGKTISLKCLVRSEGAPSETLKYLGHGIVDTISKSNTLHVATCDEEIISKQSLALFKQMNVSVSDLRGIGISLHKLESDSKKQSNTNGGIMKYVSKSKNSTKKCYSVDDLATESASKSVLCKDISKPSISAASKNAIPTILKDPSCVETRHEAYTRLKSTSAKPTKSVEQCPNTKPLILSENDSRDSYASISAPITNEEPKFCYSTSYDDVKDLIQTWISSCDVPLEIDCDQLSNYLINLINFGLMEKTYNLLLIFFKILKRVRQSNDEWFSAYKRVVSDVQLVVKQKYFLPLHLPSSF